MNKISIMSNLENPSTTISNPKDIKQNLGTNVILHGNALEKLKELPSESINCIMTSPPYWALRDYGVEGQLGLEPTFQEYINKLCDIFDECKRVLRKDGTCWVNIGDTYYGNPSGDTSGKSKKGIMNLGDESQKTRIKGTKNRAKGIMPQKSLCNIPARFSIEMQNRGWILRNVIIWHKPNCMPSSITDRFTVDFEYLFFFVKNKKYWFEQIIEPVVESSLKDNRRDKGLVAHKSSKAYGGKFVGRDESLYNSPRARTQRTGYAINGTCINTSGKNKRTVWTITTKPFKEAHFATYPEELCETPIKAGCIKEGIVLDPFFGAGTTGLVALKQNKKFIGIELNPEYIKIANERLRPYLEQRKLSQTSWESIGIVESMILETGRILNNENI